MLRVERPDVIHVTSPPSSHLAIAERSLEEGCHVYVEKPVAPTSSDTLRLISLARESRRKLTVGFTYHLDPALEALRTLEASGALGDVLHVETSYDCDLGGDYATAARRRPGHWVRDLFGGIARNHLDHPLIDVAEWLDESPCELRAHAPRVGELGIEELRLDLVGPRRTGALRFSCHARPASHVVTLRGTRDSARVDLQARTVVLASEGRLPSALGRVVGPFVRALGEARRGLVSARMFARGRFGFFEGMRLLTQRFYEAIANGTEPPVPLERIAWVSRVAEEAIGRALREAPRP
jgi:predicted dehydrogenase